MKFCTILLFISMFVTAQETNQSPHCGFDFNSYLVVETFVNNQKVILSSLKIVIVDENNNEIINKNNQFTLLNNDKTLVFTKNYKINDYKWFFPYAQESYLLLIMF